MAKQKVKNKGNIPSMQAALAPSSQKNYLGNPKTVDGLLRKFAVWVMQLDITDNNKASQEVDQKARELASIFLGQDQNYPGSPWNTPGQIDSRLAVRCGSDSKDPVERVAQALLRLAGELAQLSNDVSEQQLIEEQWTHMPGEIISRYTRLFIGLPESGLPAPESPKQKQGAIPNKLPKQPLE